MHAYGEHTGRVVVVPEFIEVIVTHVERVIAAASSHETADHQFDVARQEECSLQCDRISDIPAVPFGNRYAGERRGSFFLKRSFLFWTQRMDVGVDLEKTVGIYSKLSKEISGILIDAADPLVGTDFLHARHVADLVAVGNRQKVSQ